MSRLKVLIIGCGNIAGGFDAGKPGLPELPLTHAGAYTKDGRFEIVGCVEPDEAKREAFMRRWQVPLGFRAMDEVVNSGQTFDVISVCSTTRCHADDLRSCVKLGPKVIFCEKPVTTTAAETAQAIKSCNEANVLLAVNYTRRWDPMITELAKDIRMGRRGALRSVAGIYNKGLLNNGSHLLDLLAFILGPLNFVKAGKPINDGLADDPSVPVWLETAGGCPVQLSCGHAADYTVFELQLIFSEALVTMENGGMSWRERTPVDSQAFKGYRVLDEGVLRPGGYPKAMLCAVANIYECITGARPLISTGETALVSQQLCEMIGQA